MQVITHAEGLTPFHGALFVPTMGALHEGHYTLVRAAVQRRDPLRRMPKVIVSIFVNPTQFGDPNDLARYPRWQNLDVAGCKNAGADAVFAPPAEVIYPPDRPVAVPRLPEVATRPGLEDAHRPGHFAGVCQVVKRLFELVRPSAAFFGEKDWQQLCVISAMTTAERLGVDIVPVPTVREPDGLAMSSRNMFVIGEERERATALFQALRATQKCSTPREAENAMLETLRSRNINPEYAVVRDAKTLMPLPEDWSRSRPARALIAAPLGSVRLIDNAAWPA